VVPLITALVALFATIGSSIVAYQATRGQSEANRQLSSQEFLREEQKVAYTQFLTAVT
jgi:hypothetical protein